MGEQHLADGQHFVGAQAGDAGAAVYQGVVVDQEAGGVMGMANAGGGAEDLDVHGFLLVAAVDRPRPVRRCKHGNDLLPAPPDASCCPGRHEGDGRFESF